LPSFIYSREKNIELVKFASGIPSEAFSMLAEECVYLNQKFVAVDYHGGNFIYDPKAQQIKMVDLKRRSQDVDDYLIRRFLRLSAYDKLACFSKPGVIEEIKEGYNVDVKAVSSANVIKSYIALMTAGYTEEQITDNLRKIYNPKANIEDFEK